MDGPSASQQQQSSAVHYTMPDLQQRSSHVSTDGGSSIGSRASRLHSGVGKRKRDRFFQASLILSLIGMCFILHMVADVGEMPPPVQNAQTLAATSKVMTASLQVHTLKTELADEQKEKAETSVAVAEDAEKKAAMEAANANKKSADVAIARNVADKKLAGANATTETADKKLADSAIAREAADKKAEDAKAAKEAAAVKKLKEEKHATAKEGEKKEGEREKAAPEKTAADEAPQSIKIYMATAVFGSVEYKPQGLTDEQIATETKVNDGYVDCQDKKWKPEVSWHQNDAEDADIWIFHCRDLPSPEEMRGDPGFGQKRRPKQLWTWFCEEHDNIGEEYIGLFNLTMSMRLESDVVVSYINTDRSMADSLGHKWDTEGPMQAFPFSGRSEENPIAWAARNCKPGNNRTGYIKALMEHVGVDSFGECLHTRDGFTERGGDSEGPGLLEKDRVMKEADQLKGYKFYLSFENENCKGYVSEKLPKSYLWNLVPILGGPPDGIRHTPTGGNPPSAIIAADFANAAELAAYIKKVSANESLYMSYHAWRKNTSLITKEYRELFPPQSSRPHDICKFVDVLKYQANGNRIAERFEDCVDPSPKTGWV